MREGVGVGEIIDGADAFDLFLRHGAKNVAPDATEAVNAVICHKEKGLSCVSRLLRSRHRYN
jgi:hypothetical protein